MKKFKARCKKSLKWVYLYYPNIFAAMKANPNLIEFEEVPYTKEELGGENAKL